MDEPEPTALEGTDVLDLHSFLPRDVKDLVVHYLEVAQERGYRTVRIIHGRGTGVQRAIVRGALAGHPRVEKLADAPLEAGGWGATVVWLRTGEE